MERSISSLKVYQIDEDDQKEEPPKTHKQSIISALPRENGWLSSDDICLYQYQGFWYYAPVLDVILDDQESYRWNLSPSDILLCGTPKSGTTWLKALAFAIVTRNCYQQPENNPLLTSLPHDLITNIELPYHANHSGLPLFSTHIPYTSLPKSVLDCDCKIIYICRDPKDVFISSWHFAHKMKPNKDSAELISLGQAFDLFCRGISRFGPYWDHVLGYWKASLDHPDKLLFLKYEDMMRDSLSHVISLAKFMGYPFSNEEEMEGLPMKIVEMCSFESLSNLEVNKSGTIFSMLGFGALTNDRFFRKGKVGDWRNYLTKEMADKIDQITWEKLDPFGLRL